MSAIVQVVFSLVLVVIGIWLYLDSLDIPFIFDDRSAIVGNLDIRQLWPPTWALPSPFDHAPTNSRPLTSLSLALNYAIDGLVVRSFRYGNLTIHILCSLVLFRLMLHTCSGSVARAFTVAVLWLVHPLNSQCIHYIVQRSESLMALCYMLTLYCAARYIQQSSRRWHLAAMAFCALGMASKEVMVTAPVAVLLYDRVFAAPSLCRALALRWRLYGSLGATWTILAVLAIDDPHGTTAGFDGSVSSLVYLSNQCVVVADYLQKIVWPLPAILDYGYPRPLPFWSYAPQGFLLLLLLLWSGRATLERRPAGLAILFFFLVLAPTSSVVPLTSEVGAERRVYLAAIGPLSLLVYGIGGLIDNWRGEKNRARLLGGGLALITFAYLAIHTYDRHAAYSTPQKIWEGAVRAVSDNPRAHNNLGAILQSQGDTVQAVLHYRRALALLPDDPAALYNLARLLVAQGDSSRADSLFRRALERKPDFPQAHADYGSLLYDRGQNIEAERHFRLALHFDRRLAIAQFNVGALLQHRGEIDSAEVYYLSGLALAPDNAKIHLNLGQVRRTQGRLDEARRHYQRAIVLDSAFVAAHLSLGHLYFAAEKFDAAEASYRRALAMAPDEPRAHNSIGTVLAMRQRYTQARHHYEQALRLDPNHAQARRNLRNLADVEKSVDDP